mgnify:FL=1
MKLLIILLLNNKLNLNLRGINLLLSLKFNLTLKLVKKILTKSINFLLLGSVLLTLSNCYQDKAEIITNKNKIYSSKNYYKENRLKFKEISKKNLRNIVKSGRSDSHILAKRDVKIEDQKNSSYVVVNPGDTLYAISATYNVPNRDLIEINGLEEPYTIRAGQKLKLPSFKYHKVSEGDSLYYIARTYDMKISELIRLNDLQKPYNIHVGSKIRISETASIKKKFKTSRSQSKKRLVSTKNSDEFIWPVHSGAVISKFGQKEGGLYNDGINIKPSGDNEDVLLVKDGRVAYVGNELRGYGNLIIIKHSDSWISAYAHLDKILVKKGQKIRRGTKIATIGDTGNVSERQLYFSLRHKKEAINPEKYLKPTLK